MTPAQSAEQPARSRIAPVRESTRGPAAGNGDLGRLAPHGGRDRGAAIRQADLREHNLGLVLRHIAYAVIPPSRADVAGATGLTRATVSALVDQLIAGRLVGELPPTMSQRVGRPAVPLVPAGGTLAAVGLEVNVDYLGARAIDLAGEVLAEEVVTGDFRGSAPDPVLDRLAALTVDVLQRLHVPLAGACLALPGIVDPLTGSLRKAPNLGWRDIDVGQLLATHRGLDRLPLTMGNEATLAAQAELDVLRHSGITSFVYVSGDVGIGGAVVVDGGVFPGGHGYSGEIGHTIVDPAGPRCTCGSVGCLERFAGKDALLRRAGLDLDQPIGDLAEAATAGDERAIQSLDAAASALGIALANVVNIVDVPVVILGGIYGPLAPFLVPGIEAELQARVLSAPWSRPRAEPARARDHAAMTGAASAVLANIVLDPTGWLTR